MSWLLSSTILQSGNSLKQYARGGSTYHKALAICARRIRAIEADEISEKTKASIYHQLGMVAQEQRQWAQARSVLPAGLAI